jgi:hypothetical protein
MRVLDATLRLDKMPQKVPIFFRLRRCNTAVSVQHSHATGQSTPQNAAELGLRPAKCRKHMPLRGPDKMPTAHAGICWLALARVTWRSMRAAHENGRLTAHKE